MDCSNAINPEMKKEADPESTTSGWDTYWQGAQSDSAFNRGGATHPLIKSFWSESLAMIRERNVCNRVIDIASGSGSVIEAIESEFGEGVVDISCVDISASAIDALTRRFPQVHGIQSDATSIPLESGSFDLVTSQFGIEYAGVDAFAEAARLVDMGGCVAFLIHHRQGGIYHQCSASAEAISVIRSSQFIHLAREMFEAGFATLQGGERSAFEEAARAFVPALHAVEEVLHRFGREVADGTVVQLYKDVREIHGHLSKYHQDEVIAWLTALDLEIDAFEIRMQSMCAAAIDSTTFLNLVEQLRKFEFSILRAAPLVNANTSRPLAWALVASKDN